MGEGEGEAAGEAVEVGVVELSLLDFLCFFLLFMVVVVVCVVLWSVVVACGVELLLWPAVLLELCPAEPLPDCATAKAPPRASAQIVMRIFFIAFSLIKDK